MKAGVEKAGRPASRIPAGIITACAAVFLLGMAGAASAEQDKTEIGGLKIKFTDVSVLPLDEMRKAVEEDVLAYLKSGRRRSCLEDAAWRLAARLKREGRPFARTGFEAAENGLRVRFDVYPGPEVELRRISFKGAEFFTNERLEEVFKAGKVFPLVEGKRLYVKERVEDAVSEIRGLYREAGYIWAQVAEEPVEFSKDRTRAFVAISIVEGRRAVVSAVGFTGARLENPAAIEGIAGLKGSQFNPGLPLRVRNMVREFYAAAGYPFCRIAVTPVIDSKTGSVLIDVAVQEGRKTYVRRISVEGNSLTLDSVVLHIAGLSQGDLFDMANRRRALTDLCLQGLFEEVDVSAKPVEGEPESVDVLIKVRESDHIKIECSAGFHSYEWLNGEVKISSPNTFGTGRSVWIGGELSFREWKVESGLCDPWVMNLPFRGQWRGFVGRRIEEEFSKFFWGMDFTFTFPFSRRISASASYHYEFSDVYKAEEGVDITKARQLNISSVGLGLLFDFRDSVFDPKWGFLVDLFHEFGGRGLRGGVSFDRSILKASACATPLLGITFCVAGEASIVDPKARTEDIPIQLRLFRGGISSVRSFGERRLGPRNAAGSVIGGEAYLQVNLEARFPFSEFGDIPLLKLFGIAVFFDTGSIKERAAHWLHLTGFRHAVGVGLRLNTPIGPLRFDAGWNPDRRHNEDAYALHVTIGHPF